MRLLLINPFYPISETPSPPLGLAFLAGALEEAGVEAKILDFVVTPYTKEALENTLTDFKPGIVGVTSVTMSFYDAIDIVRDIKMIASDILTVMGGPHVTFNAEKTLEAYPELDFIVLGEGEATLTELASAAENSRNWEKIQGIAYREGDEIKSNGQRADLLEVDKIPLPARHLIPLGRYRALGLPVSMTTSRGCPFKCIFCVGRKMVGAKVRYRNPERVVDELEDLKKLRFHQINIADDLFTANKNHCLAVCNEMIKRELGLTWTSFARVDTVSRELLSVMKTAGCQTVSFGVESANAEILKTIKKGITIEQVLDAVEMTTDAGITPQVSFILGLPGETPETIQETVDFGEKLKKKGVCHGFHLLAPFPGTEVRENSDAYGIKILTDDWKQYHANRAIVETPQVNRMMMDEIVIKWEEEFDEYLGEIKRLMQTGEATENEAWQLTKLEHTVLLYELMMGRSIEKWGVWKNGKRPVSAKDALETLSDRISPPDNFTEEQLHNALQYAVEGENLIFTQENGNVTCKWADYL